MKTSPISRRSFVKNAALAAAAVPLAKSILQGAGAANPKAAPKGISLSVNSKGIRWLDGSAPGVNVGATWGTPWPKGTVPRNTTFALRDTSGKAFPVQTWTTAWWPDGSIKWTASAIPAGIKADGEIDLVPGRPIAPEKPVTVRDNAESIEVDTGLMRCSIAKSGGMLIQKITRDGKPVLVNGRLVALSADSPETDDAVGAAGTKVFQCNITAVTIEQEGPVRAVVKIEGRHSGGGRSWLPFSVRLYFYAGGENVRMMHSFIYDGDPGKDFLRGLGVRFEVPMSDPLYDRHVRFVGEGRGLWAEAVLGLTGLRLDPDAGTLPGGRGTVPDGPIKRAQLAGEVCPPLSAFNSQVSERLQYVPAWGDCTLFQPAANAFTIRKRTKAGHGWVDVDQGTRAAGVGYVGGANGGGVVFGLRDFWQRHPVQLDIRGAHTETAEVTVWMYSPKAEAMDLRFYHDGLGMDTHEKQRDGGLPITYEDYEPGWGDAHGIARSSELFFWALPATPSREAIIHMADQVRTPALLMCSPRRLYAAKVFGAVWSLPDRSTPAKAAIEDRLEWQIEFYKNQVEQRHWYGFWNYGDVMHGYDRDRHVWRYDVGGFAWDNSELSPDLWLWQYFLRTGRADVFRFAEAMTRHTGEVDMYHVGRFAGLGSRHNVQHWGCSVKQARISSAAYRRIYYFLTADERVGDLMHALVDVDRKIKEIDPARKVKQPPLGTFDIYLNFGLEWATLAAAWLTEWERGGDTKYRDKLLRGMRDFGTLPRGFFSSNRYGFRFADGSVGASADADWVDNGVKVVGAPSVSHLESVFGALETFAELIQMTDGQPEYEGFKKAWLQYCRLYNASSEERIAELGVDFRGASLFQAYSRITAYAAMMNRDKKLAARAWDEFYERGATARGNRAETRETLQTQRIEGPAVLNPVDEAAWVSTNAASQWGLAGIECLALIGDMMPAGK